MAEDMTNINGAAGQQDSPSSQDEVSPELDAMVCDLLDDFLNGLADGEELGVGLCVEDARGNRYQAAFVEDDLHACIDGARHFVQLNEAGVPSDHVGPIDRYAIAYTGAVELEDGFEDAIIVSFYQRGMACGYSAYVLYANAGQGERFMWSDPEPAGEEPPLI